MLFLAASGVAKAQRPNILQGVTSRIGQIGASGSTGNADSLQHRTEDSIQVRFYYYDSSRAQKFDSSILDFTKRYPVPATSIYLGNTGTSTRSILFAPRMKAGWDPGFHAFDAYKWQLKDVRFFNTTRPYTELGYMLGSRAEQLISILHTQNLRPYWNASFQYRLINAPGNFRNQTANQNNYLLTSWYQSPSKRYTNYFIILSNKLQTGENGGIKNVQDLKDPIYEKDRYTIPTNIGGQPVYGTNFLSTNIYTGNKYTETNYLLRQQYDFGKKDSLVTDSTVIPLFFPRLRLEHTFKYGKYSYIFEDLPVNAARQSNRPDSAYYQDKYNITLRPDSGSVFLKDQWKEISNDFSVYQFPDAKNLQQFIKLGMEVQLLKGQFKGTQSLYNVMGHGEYRNKTKNQKWDMLASGQLYLNGYNAGDYHAYISLQRLINPKIGSLQVGFENMNRTPPFIYNAASRFYLDTVVNFFNKENIVHFFGSVLQPKSGLQLSADYYLVTNYLYLTNFFRLQQQAAPFNVLRINALKTFKIGRHWRWHAEVYVQQNTGSVQLRMPALYTRNRFGYEGSLGFPNLSIAFGTEVRYYTPYKADNYSPVLGQFFYQDSVTINNKPQVDLYFHLRIRGFKAYIRGENLNTASFANGFKFTNNNFAAPGYPTPGFILRFGIFWSFVN